MSRASSASRFAISSTAIGGALAILGCAPGPRTETIWPTHDRPIMIDREARTVRFTGIVPVDARSRPMLETIVSTPNTREHESLVMADVRPSSIHAGLLALGAQPGQPGGLYWNGSRFELREPSGDRIEIRLRSEHHDRWSHPSEWFFTDPATDLQPRWLFTGSALREDGRYSADDDGVIVGLVSFTTELIGMDPAIPDLDAQRGFDFFADPIHTPPFGTRVLVELRLIEPSPTDRQPNNQPGHSAAHP